MDFLNSIWQFWILAPLGVIGLFLTLVIIHELGHYWAGRIFGVGSEEFSIGFGPALFSVKDRRGTLWSLRLLPLGGFVKFVGDADASSRPDPKQDAMEARKESLASLAIWKRSVVVAAGPLANILLAFLLFSIHSMLIGRTYQEPLIGRIETGSIADVAGLRVNDRIVMAGGAQIDNFRDLNLIFEINLGHEIDIEVVREGQPQTVTLGVVPRVEGLGSSPFGAGIWPQEKLEITKVESGSPAADMGLRVGDFIVGYNQTPLADWQSFLKARTDSIGQPMDLWIERGEQSIVLNGIPQGREIVEGQGEIGVFGIQTNLFIERRRLGVFEALGTAQQDLRRLSLLIFKLPAQFIRQQRDLDDLGGPVRIAEEVGQVVVFAPTVLLFMTGLISLQLGIINLFPIPILDGGHLMLYLAEAIWRRPLSPVLITWLYRFGGAVIFVFFIAVTANDLRRLIIS